MRPDRERKGARSFFLHSVDHLGRQISPPVLEIAQQLARDAVGRAEKFSVDPALALTLLEQVAASVTRVIREKELLGEPPIEDLRRYLFRSFMHQLEKENRRKPEIVTLGDIDWSQTAPEPGLNTIERGVFGEELLRACGKVNADIVLRRQFGGQSWPEIAAAHGITATAARLRFRRAIDRMRRLIGSSGSSA
jgi:hypothetical protein